MGIKKLIKEKLLSSNPGLLGKIYSFRKSFLTKSKQIHYSQFGEDVVLKDWILNKDTGFFVDVGCYHPTKHSNTYQLYKKGWRGINVDLSRLKINTFNFVRPEDENIVAAVSDIPEELTIYHDGLYSLGATLDKGLSARSPNKVITKETIKTRTLNNILNSSRFNNHEIDILSIDAEGYDYSVLKSLDLIKYLPKIILIEQHANRISDIIESQVYNHLIKAGYEFCNWVGYTLFFTHPACNFIKSRNPKEIIKLHK